MRREIDSLSTSGVNMSAALYPVLNNDVPAAAEVDGKALADAGDALDRLAGELGVTPLSTFISVDDDDYGILEEADIEAPAGNWFPAAQGLSTVRALLGVLRQNAKTQEALVDDLVALEKVLMGADASGAEWHLAIDM